MAQQLGGPTLSSPSQLLAELEKSSAGAGGPALQELLGSVQRQQGGGAAPPPLPEERLEVFPEPGFVVKTANEQGQKVFINVCGSGKMPLPPGWTKGGQVPAEVERHLEGGREGDAPASMRFPMSMGAARIDADHSGQPCLVLDCILSSDVLAACAAHRPLKLFLIQLALGLAAQQTGLELDPQYRLPKMRYKGEGGPPPQLIRVAPGVGGVGAGGGGPGEGSGDNAAGGGPAGGMPLISEVHAGQGAQDAEPGFALLAGKRQQRQSAAVSRQRPAQQAAPAHAAAAPDASGAPAAAGSQQPQRGSEQLPVLQPCVEYEGVPANAVRITVPLPANLAAAAAAQPGGVQASVCAETVRVQVAGCQPAEVRLPFAVSAQGSSAELVPAGVGAASGGGGASSSTGKQPDGPSLVLVLPYRPFGSVLEELRQAAAAAEGLAVQRQDSDGGLMDLD